MPQQYTLSCAQCGEPFTVAPYRVKEKARYCSNACKAEGQRRPLAERFWEKVDRSAGDGCWTYSGAHNHLGYGIVRVDGRNIGAHRVAYELTHGPIPEGYVICHMCDNGACC